MALTYEEAVHALSVTDESEYAGITVSEAREQLWSGAETSHIRLRATTPSQPKSSTSRSNASSAKTPVKVILDDPEGMHIDLVAIGPRGQAVL